MKISRSRHARHTNAEKKTRRMNLWRHICSFLLLLLAAIPMLGGGVRAMWVIPAAVCICMNEDVYVSMAAGVVAGLLIDFTTGAVLCANAMYLAVVCTFISLLFRQFFKRRFVSYIGITALCVFLRAGGSYLMTQVLFQVEDREILWHDVLLPSCLWTLPVAVVIYLAFLPVSRLLTRRVKSMDAAAIHREGA